MKCRDFDSPIGVLRLTEENGALIGLDHAEKKEFAEESSLLAEAEKQISEYLAGTRKEFSLPIELRGTEFQKKVWGALREIPYGETRSYGWVAERIGKPKAVRAVGGANHRNPVMIVVPCHRCIGKDGSLIGFGGGLPMKEALLDLEQRHSVYQ